MKYLFFLVLLGNIVFFLWEINSGVETTDSQRETYSSDRENLILLLSEIDLGEATEKISTEIQNLLGRPDTNNQENSDMTNAGQDQFPEISEREPDVSTPELELMQKEDAAELPDTGQQVRSENEEPTEDSEAGQQLTPENETIEAPESELESVTEETVEAQTTKNDEVVSVKKKQQVETENSIVQFFFQKPDIKPEQDNKRLSCYEVGPFADKEDLQLWQNQLEAEIVFLGIQNRNIEEIKDYMIIYPAAETYEKSEENASRLRENGFNDLWLFEKGDNRGAISLGLFESKPYAEKAQVQYKQDGLIVKIKPRFRDVQRYFISLELDDQQHEKILKLTPKMELSSCS